MGGKKDRSHFLRGKILSGRVYPEFFAFNLGDRVLNIGCGEGAQVVVYAGQYREMIGIDINRGRLEKSKEAMRLFKICSYTPIVANVEKTPFSSGTFDKAIAVDIVEHVQSPHQLCCEAHRTLNENGEMLITFPAMHDKFTSLVTALVHIIKRQRNDGAKLKEWNPDAHNQSHSVGEWIRIIEESGFKLTKVRASTLFPPLHLYGIPRFWFANDFIHRIDSWLCRLPLLRNYGQSMVCVFRKQNLQQDD
jgi:cyclopropane fatty-acyl-phospholipid synthase-like methyltransferase